MSLDHLFFNKEENEICFLQKNYFIEYSFSHIINDEWYTKKEVIKSELRAIVAEYGDCISKLGKGNVILSKEELYDMEDNDILNNERSALFFSELITHFKPAVLEYLNCECTVRYSLVRMFHKFIDAYFKLRELLGTFDFENDKLTIEQAG